MKTCINHIRQSQFFLFVVRHYRSSELSLSSIAVAYYLLLTIFPFLMLLANLFPYLPIDTSAFLLLLKDSLPDRIYPSVAELIRRVFNERSDGLLGLAIITGLWTMSRSLTFLQKAINKAYDVQEHRDVLVGRLVALLTSLLLVILVVLAVLIGIFGKVVLEMCYRYGLFTGEFYQMIRGMTQPLMLFMFAIAMGLLYYVMPNVKIVKFRYILPGTLMTTVVIWLVMVISEHYLSFALQRMEYLRFIGSVATFAVMFWFIFLSKLIIVGAVLNAAYQKTCEEEIVLRRGRLKEFF